MNHLSECNEMTGLADSYGLALVLTFTAEHALTMTKRSIMPVLRVDVYFPGLPNILVITSAKLTMLGCLSLTFQRRRPQRKLKSPKKMMRSGPMIRPSVFMAFGKDMMPSDMVSATMTRRMLAGECRPALSKISR